MLFLPPAKNNRKLSIFTILFLILSLMIWILLLTKSDVLFLPLYTRYLLGADVAEKVLNPVEVNPSSLYKPAVDYEKLVMQSVDDAIPSVISIGINKKVPIYGECRTQINPIPNGNIGEEELRRIVPNYILTPCEKGKEVKEVAGGSGFVIGDGYIVTNKHVISDKTATYEVKTSDGKVMKAKVIALDPVVDIGILKTEDTSIKSIKIGDSDKIKLGQTAIAIGNSLGKFNNSVSVGIIAGLSRNIQAMDGATSEQLEDIIQTDAPISRGNSGGPLLNLRGEVIGVNVAIAEDGENIAFAIPINQVKRAIKSIKEHGKIIVPFLGVRYKNIDPELIKAKNLTQKEGALVEGDYIGKAVLKDSPAELAGIKSGDIITHINGEKIDLSHSLVRLVTKYSVGETIKLKVIRDKETLELQVILKERPENP